VYKKNGIYYRDDGTEIPALQEEVSEPPRQQQQQQQTVPIPRVNRPVSVPTAPKPVYSDSYAAEKRRVQAQLDGRGPFVYDAGRDPLYRDYRDRYVQEGRLAMRDTVGKAAALTGGYGSSYGEAAGQQAFDTYLRKLGEVIPTLYGLAYQRWSDEGAALQSRAEALDRAQAQEYARYRDDMADWARERDYAMKLEQAEYERMADEYARETAAEAEQYKRRQAELQRQDAAEKAAYEREQDAYKRRQDAYNRLYKAIRETGYRPTDDELREAGMSREAAHAAWADYDRGYELDERNMVIKEMKQWGIPLDASGHIPWDIYDPVADVYYYFW